MRHRLAPSPARMLISRTRDSARTSVRLPRLKQAINSTRTASNVITSTAFQTCCASRGLLKPSVPRYGSSHSSEATRVGSCRASSCMVVVRLAFAASRETPGRRRPYISLSVDQSVPTRLPGTNSLIC